MIRSTIGMNNFEQIKEKLEHFIRKYYINALIKGALLFFATGVLYFLFTLLLEYWLWLGTTGRTLLFWVFIVVESSLLVRFIIIPGTKLFKVSKGIDHKKASEIIGKHFPDVNDKLLNLLQLQESKSESTLLVASIEQKSTQLAAVPFKAAIDFTKNKKYVKYAALPIIVFLFFSVVMSKNWFNESYTRMVNYKTAYQPPAPFQFLVLNDTLATVENKDYKLRVKTKGEVVPENASITYNGEVYFLQHIASGMFEHVFIQPKETIEFVLNANEVQSIPLQLEVTAVPLILNFDLELSYPRHTHKKDRVIKGSGNATIPEGTRVKWKVTTRNTNQVQLKTRDTSYVLKQDKSVFSIDKKVYTDLSYHIATSNTAIHNYDDIAFKLKVDIDEYPELNIASKKDTLDDQITYFSARVSDDYGLHKLQLVYYKSESPTDKIRVQLPIKKSTLDEFLYTFPNTLPLEKGISYYYYFEVFDNDQLHNYKQTKSKEYSFRKLTDEEEKNANLVKQKESISGLNQSLQKFKERSKDLKDISKLQKEKKELDYNDRKKLKEFLARQKEQEKLMQNFSKELKKNMEELSQKKEPFKDALKERLERNEERLEKNKKLLEEIEKLNSKLDKDKLTEKLEKLNKENKNINKNLEQLLELTKRFYVVEKHERLAEQLYKLAEEQKKLADKKENSKEQQQKMNASFKAFQKEMESLRKENEGLRKPMSLDQKKEEEQGIAQEQQKATENLEEEQKEDAQKNQKSAAEKMKQMADGMQKQMQASGEAQQQEDTEMLRQILDNLVGFSLEQEILMKRFKESSLDHPRYPMRLKRQSVLRENFIHIDDSLYALALRTPQIADDVTKKLTDVSYNLDKSLEKLADNQLGQGTASQQYVITGSNDLAYMLSQALDQMQNSMPKSGSGKGKSKGFQLPDIIKKQGELNEEMKKGMEKGKKGEEGKEGEKGEQGKQGKQGKEGEQGKSGKSGKNGKDGKGEGEEGSSGKGGKGKSGKDGKQAGGKDGKEGSFGEEMNGRLYEIYKEQQQLRKALEDKVKKEGLRKPSNSQMLKKMEQVEQQLLEKGFNENTLRKMENIKHELMKLEDATLEQGEEEKRQSKSNVQEFDIRNIKEQERIKQYFNTTEILNRQVLPLRYNYKRKVQEYFRNPEK